MTKYTAVLKTSFKQESKTITNTIVSVVSFFVIIFIFNELWGFIYGSGVGSTINGYSLKMMIWYMVAAEILMYAFNARTVTRSFSDDIKSGKIAYGLNKPYNYFLYQIANNTGAFCWKLLFLLPAGVIIGSLLLGTIENFSIAYVLPIIFSLFFATFLSALMYGLIGLLAFWVEEATPFAWILQKFNMLFGLFFPPEFFPAWLQPIITYSPVYACVSGPSKLLANFSWELFARVSITQMSYTVLFIALGLIIFKFGTRKVSNNGG